MYVIFPADELILMTYGAALPRVSPRPTLDCLREPKVPIVYPSNARSTNSPNAANVNTTATATAVASLPSLPAQSQWPAPPPTPTQPTQLLPSVPLPPASQHFPSQQVTGVRPPQAAAFSYDSIPVSVATTAERSAGNFSQSLPPTPTRRTSKGSLSKGGPAAASSKRSSVRSTRSGQATPPPHTAYLHPHNLQQTPPHPYSTGYKTAPPTPKTSMSNEASNRSGVPATPQQQHRAMGSQRRSVDRSSVVGSPVLQRGTAYDPGHEYGVAAGGGVDYPDGGGAAGYSSRLEYPTGALSRDRSPSIVLEPASNDPTRLSLGSGWGRPMSPMELPPNPPPTKTPSSPSKSRLRPKLHIPLGRLGRSASSDQRESQRLKEDLHLHVENPIFNSENLRQRNFDAFFESGEPVYKLHPRGATTAPAAEGAAALPPLDKYAGMYGAPKVAGHGESSLFARSPREAALKQRSMSDEKYEPPQPREARATSVSSVVPQKDFSGKSSGGPKSRRFFGWRGPRGGSLSPQASMASYNGVLKEYGHSGLTEAFKSQNNVNFKLIKTVSDFTETLSQLYEEHATALQTLVSNYRKKNGDLRKERPACHLTIFQAWETFLQEVETDSQASNDVASVLSRQVSRPMLDKSFHRKVQSRKIFTHRESFETIIAKTEEKLSKCRLDYKQCYVAHRQSPTQHTLTEYIDAHNAYVQQLHATNGMLELYHTETVPSLMQELEEIHNDLYSIIADSLLQGADVIAGKASEQAKRYSNLTLQCSSVSPVQDLTNFVRILPQPPPQGQKIPRRIFAPPQPLPGEPEEAAEYNEIMPVLRDELVFDRNSTLSLRPALESLKREAMDLEMQIRQLQDSVDALSRTQTRGIEGQLYNKINELQEDLLLKKFDMRAKQIHLAAIKAQKELFVSKVDPGSPRAERKFSAATAPSMKTKWLKAFRSLKPASGSAAPSDKRNGAGGSSAGPLRPNEDGSHHLQEYTYKKITACDVCSQILRGHTRQGLRCRICKLNAHGDCASQLPRCQPKQKLLRRQKSTSELENRVDIEEERSDGNECLQNDDELQLDAADASGKLPAASKFRQKVPFIDRITQLEFTEIDQIYRVLKQAGELKSAHLAAASASGGGGAEKAVQMKDGGLIGSSGVGVAIGGGGIAQQDIPIVNVPDYPERAGFSTAPTSSVAAVAQAAAARAGRGIRPPPVPMPILGVQIQQQELQQQRGALPVPAQDISSSSDCRLTSVVAQLQQQQQQQQPLPQPPPQYAHKSKPLQQQALPANQSVAHMPTAAYISSGLGINYYTASARNPRGSITAATALAGAQTLGAVAVGAGVGSTPAAAAAVSSSPPSTSNGALGSPYQQLQQKHFSSDASGMRRRLFAGCRQLSGYGSAYGVPGGMRNNRSAQHRSISLPETPHSPRRQKLNLRMKSLSLDSPESTEIHGQMRRRQHPVVGPPSTTNAGGYYHSGSGGQLEHCTPPSNNSRLHSPSSPSHQGRKLLYASRGMRGGSVDLPDDMEKSQSSASTSPCPSPVRQFQKSHRLLPTNLYVVLYNFKARHGDELDLKAGYKVTVIDTSDPDWWKGKLLGRVGYFPSKYCVRLNANEKPLQVTHNLQVSDGERGENMTLLRDQIVIQTGDEVNGMVMVRSADNRQGYCPIKYLQEV